MSSITITTSSFGAINSTVTGQAPATITLEIGTPGPQGQQGIQGIQGPQGPVGPSGVSSWGGITGIINNQTDLQSALDVKLTISSAVSTYQPLSDMYNYLTVNNASTTYQTVSGMVSYAFKSSPTFTGIVTVPTPATSSNTTVAASTAFVKAQGYSTLASPTFTGDPKAPTPATSDNDTSVATTAFVKAQGYSTIASPTFTGTVTIPSGASISGYLTTSSAASTYAVIAAGQPVSGTVGQVLTKNSGTNYDSSWTTLVPGDRYLTTSTTSNSIANGAKTFTVGTGLSYTPTQDCTIAYDAANHMHATVTTYNSSTGVLVVDVNQHSGTGTYTVWTVNVGGAVPSTTIAWGAITGTLGDQSDLSTALNAKLASADAATTYQTISGMSSYLTTADATSTYQPISGMISYPTFIDADGRYLQLSGGAMAVNSSITVADSGIGSDSQMGGFGFGVENTSHSKQASLEFDGVSITSSVAGSYGTNVNTATIQGDSANFSYTGYDSYGAFSGATNYYWGGLSLSYTATGISQSISLNPTGVSSTNSNFGSTNNWSLDGTNGIQWNNGTANGQFGPSGIRFADGSTQTTAYTGSSGVSWGSISGTLSSQTDLQSALDGKYSTSNPSGFTSFGSSDAISAVSGGSASYTSGATSPGQVLTYNGSGGLYWTSPGGGGGSPPYSESVWIYNQWYSATIQTVYTTSYSYVNVLTF